MRDAIAKIIDRVVTIITRWWIGQQEQPNDDRPTMPPIGTILEPRAFARAPHLARRRTGAVLIDPAHHDAPCPGPRRLGAFYRGGLFGVERLAGLIIMNGGACDVV